MEIFWRPAVPRGELQTVNLFLNGPAEPAVIYVLYYLRQVIWQKSES